MPKTLKKTPYPRFSRLIAIKQNLTAFIGQRPFTSFLSLLFLIVALAVIGNVIKTPKPTESGGDKEPTPVSVFTIGQSPTVQVDAKVEKNGVIKIVALSGGVVSKVNVTEGTTIGKGARIVTLASNYQGANVQSLARQISQKSYDNVVATYDTQKDLISKNRAMAEKAEAQSGQLREIARKSIDDTKSLISLNEQIVTSLDTQIGQLEASNVNGANDATLTQLRSSKAQVLSGLVNLRTGLRNTEYLNDDTRDAAELGRLSRDATLRQLDVQEKGLELSKEIAALNLKISKVSESLMYPTTPISGVVERVYVKPGMSVAPGTPLASIRGTQTTSTAIALVSADVARAVMKTEDSTIVIGENRYPVKPLSVALEPTDGTLHAVVYALPQEVSAQVAAGAFVSLRIPVGQMVATDVFIPLDALYQSQERAYVFVVKQEEGKTVAHSVPVDVGTVYGQYVAVLAGLEGQTQVVVNRDIVDGEEIVIQ